jgi:hypothetical protein
MRPVADEPGEYDGRKRRREAALGPSDGSDRVPDDEIRVGDRDAGSMRDGELELSRGVLGMELHHPGTLLLEGTDQGRRERLDVGECDQTIGGTGVRGDRIRLGLTATELPPAEEELHLVGTANLQAERREPFEHRAGERPGACRVGLALLVELVDGRQRPARAGGQPEDGCGVRHQTGIARRSTDMGRGGDLVVHEEDREHR